MSLVATISLLVVAVACSMQAACARRLQHFVVAITEINLALARYPRYKGAIMEKGRIFMDMGRNEKAQEMLLAAVFETCITRA